MDGSTLPTLPDISAILILLFDGALCLSVPSVVTRVGPLLLALLKSTKWTAEYLTKGSGGPAEVRLLLRYPGQLGRGLVQPSPPLVGWGNSLGRFLGRNQTLAYGESAMSSDRVVWLRPEPTRRDDVAYYLYSDCHLIRSFTKAEVRKRSMEAAIDEGRLLCSFCGKRTNAR